MRSCYLNATCGDMRAIQRRLRRRYREAGAGAHYAGRYYPGPHKFDVAMPEDDFAWLETHMRA
jgi:hypothetical protein